MRASLSHECDEMAGAAIGTATTGFGYRGCAAGDFFVVSVGAGLKPAPADRTTVTESEIRAQQAFSKRTQAMAAPPTAAWEITADR
jgi:hypothetical protein